MRLTVVDTWRLDLDGVAGEAHVGCASPVTFLVGPGPW
jgi:hypothetical protein